MSAAEDGESPSRPAWQPFTFGGIAAFARAGVGRLLLAELAIALIFTASCVGFFQDSYVPVVCQAVEEMPESARLEYGHIRGVNTTIIAENKHLAIAVSPEPFVPIGQSADVQFQFRPTNFRVGTVYRPDWGLEFNYDPAITLDLSRSNLEPWWGAWRPVWLAAAGVLIFMSLFVIWAAMALIYTLPAKLLAWFLDRELTTNGAWQLGSAALLPGTLLLTLGVMLYAAQTVDLIWLGYFYLTHMLMGWVYAIGGVVACPRQAKTEPARNPFVS